jgi:hypothetical protein
MGENLESALAVVVETRARPEPPHLLDRVLVHLLLGLPLVRLRG